ncbi:MAG: 30S ribosome-binding factor RbfA [Alistipes sp.]|nr:30S ribosome-binding factor RbfA [Alistipes sp.]
MENTRQQKIARQIQRDVAEILQKDAADLVRGSLVTVTAVRISPDLAYSKIYVSVFPFDRKDQVLAALGDKTWMVRKLLGARIRNQLKIVPEIEFFLDDSLEYIDNIDQLLHGQKRD